MPKTINKKGSIVFSSKVFTYYLSFFSLIHYSSCGVSEEGGGFYYNIKYPVSMTPGDFAIKLYDNLLLNVEYGSFGIMCFDKKTFISGVYKYF